MRLAPLLALCAAALPGLARADNPACAKFEEPLAYNACLASHGPKATDIGAARATGSPSVNPDSGKAGPALRRMTGRAVRRHGRMHMEFMVR